MPVNSQPSQLPRPRKALHRRKELKEDRDLNRPRYNGPCYQPLSLSAAAPRPDPILSRRSRVLVLAGLRHLYRPGAPAVLVAMRTESVSADSFRLSARARRASGPNACRRARARRALCTNGCHVVVDLA